jgi:CRISPR/Cas system CSM-associated protein Csm2 small subunit
MNLNKNKNSNKNNLNNTQLNKENKEIEEIEINDESECDWLSAVLDKPTFRARRSIQNQTQRKLQNKSPEIEIIDNGEEIAIKGVRSGYYEFYFEEMN